MVAKMEKKETRQENIVTGLLRGATLNEQYHYDLSAASTYISAGLMLKFKNEIPIFVIVLKYYCRKRRIQGHDMAIVPKMFAWPGSYFYWERKKVCNHISLLPICILATSFW